MQINRMDVELPGGRMLYVALVHDSTGDPTDLIIAAGYATEPVLSVLGSGVNVPASALPELRDALASVTAA